MPFLICFLYLKFDKYDLKFVATNYWCEQVAFESQVFKIKYNDLNFVIKKIILQIFLHKPRVWENHTSTSLAAVGLISDNLSHNLFVQVLTKII